MKPETRAGAAVAIGLALVFILGRFMELVPTLLVALLVAAAVFALTGPREPGNPGSDDRT